MGRTWVGRESNINAHANLKMVVEIREHVSVDEDVGSAGSVIL